MHEDVGELERVVGPLGRQDAFFRLQMRGLPAHAMPLSLIKGWRNRSMLAMFHERDVIERSAF
jgi:hypothetical protein